VSTNGSGNGSGKSVVILLPTGDMVLSSFAASLANMLCYTSSVLHTLPLEGLSVQFYGSSVLPFSRKMLAEFVIELGYTHALFIDSDMEFPHDMLAWMLQYKEKIVGINAMSRRPPYRCTARISREEPLLTTEESTGLEKVWRMGFGVAWIATEVFRRLEQPWFDFVYRPDLGVFQGEDYYFCEKAQEAGYDIWIDHDLSKRVYHVGTFRYSPLIASVPGFNRYFRAPGGA
jgi:hypothetical protein